MTAGALALRLAHAAIAIAIVGWLASILVERRADLAKVRDLADQEAVDRDRAKADLVHGQAIRDGLKRDDPYVVEYLARERLQFAGPGELTPPQQQAPTRQAAAQK